MFGKFPVTLYTLSQIWVSLFSFSRLLTRIPVCSRSARWSLSLYCLRYTIVQVYVYYLFYTTKRFLIFNRCNQVLEPDFHLLTSSLYKLQQIRTLENFMFIHLFFDSVRKHYFVIKRCDIVIIKSVIFHKFSFAFLSSVFILLYFLSQV